MRFRLRAAAVLLCATALNAGAAILIGVEPPSNLIVYAGGLEWVYAAPCAPDGCGTITLHHGFRLPTTAEWLLSFSNLDDVYTQFTTPSNKCAAPYFSNEWNHCDFQDLASGYVYGSPFAPNDYFRFNYFAETFLVRGSAVPIPEPSSVVLVGAGLSVAALLRRRGGGV